MTSCIGFINIDWKKKSQNVNYSCEPTTYKKTKYEGVKIKVTTIAKQWIQPTNTAIGTLYVVFRNSRMTWEICECVLLKKDKWRG